MVASLIAAGAGLLCVARSVPLVAALMLGSSIPLPITTTSSPQSSPPATVPRGRPAWDLSDTGNFDRMEILSPGSRLYGRAQHSMLSKTVGLMFMLEDPGGSGEILDRKPHTESVAYWPTTVAVLDDQTIAVAGKGADPLQKMTVIEIWRIRRPIVESVLGGGNAHFTSGARVISKTVVYEGAVVGRDVVRLMCRVRGKPASLFVQFHDSGDLYALDYSELDSPSDPPPATPFPLTLVLSATAGAGVPHVPELAEPKRTWMHATTHSTEGYNYTLMPSFGNQTLGDNPPEPLTLFDHSLDGQLEEWGVFTAAENQARGLLDDSLYTEWHLATEW